MDIVKGRSKAFVDNILYRDLPDPTVLSSEKLTNYIGSQDKRNAAAGLGLISTLLGGLMMGAGEVSLRYQDQSSGIARAVAFGLLVSSGALASANMLRGVDVAVELVREEQRRCMEQQQDTIQEIAEVNLASPASGLITHGDN